MPSERVQRRIDSLLDEAESALRKNEWSAALECANAVLAIDPQNADALTYLKSAERGQSRIPPTAGASSGAAPHPQSSQISSPLPTSFASGRYAVKKFLGEGGKKKVFLAHDTTLDRDVAFALIKSEGLDDAARARVIREAQVMGRLGDHPNLMPIFDLGREGDQPFMVLPLMPGGDVEGAIKSANAGGLDLEMTVRIAIDICRGLDFAHSKGIVHRDLKPGNVWLTDDGTAKIGDWGLALPLEQTRLTAHGMMVGTVAYMPPEQALGGEITAKADLYSLGCMLYEMVTGRPPFLGDDHVAIIGQHINTAPVAPSWHSQRCPKPLEALIMRLLAKDPAQRPESADDVLNALSAASAELRAPAAGGVQGDPSTAAGSPRDGRSLDSLAAGVFVGRQKEIGELRAALEETLSGHGRLVMLVGEPGIGKSRSSLELATYAGLRRCQVLWGRCYEAQGAPPYWPWVQALRSYVREASTAELRMHMGSGAADIAQIVSDVRERLPDLGTPPPLDSPEAARFRLFDSIAAFLRGAAKSQPLVIVLDDLHWADRPSLLLLEFVAREIGTARLLVLGTYRDVEINRRHPLSQTLGELNRDRLFSRIHLKGLSEEDVGRFIELTAGTKVPRGLTQAVHSQTEGNPLFVTEVVRLLVQEGEFSSDRLSSSRTWTVEIPAGVREVIGRRLDRLSERCNEVLALASVIGREFTLRQLLAVTNDESTAAEDRVTEERLLQLIEEALGARVIEELPSEIARYQFTHALIQETLARELSVTRRSRLHARIAIALERLYGQRAEEHAAELVHHFAAAAAIVGPEKIVRYSIAAGERSLTNYAFEEAQEHFQRGLDANPDMNAGAGTAALQAGLGTAQARTLQIRSALENLSKALDYYAQVGDTRGAIRVASCPLPAYAGQLEGAPALVERALKMVSPETTDAGYLLVRYGAALYYQEADTDRAVQALQNALELSDRLRDRHLRVLALAELAFLSLYQLKSSEAVDLARQAADMEPAVDEPGAMTEAHYAAALSLITLGRLSESLQSSEAAVAQAGRLRHRDWMSRVLMGLSIFHLVQGQWDDARRWCAKGTELAPDDFRHQMPAALVDVHIGDSISLESHLSRLLDIAASSPAGPTAERAVAAAGSIVCAVVTGDWSRSKVSEAFAYEVISAPRSTALVEAMARVGLGLLAAHRGDRPSASEQLQKLKSYAGKYLFVITADRVLGRLSEAVGSTESALQCYRNAVDFCRGAGYKTELAWALYEFADLADQEKSTVTSKEVISAFEESLAIATRLGMKPLVERIIARKHILKA